MQTATENIWALVRVLESKATEESVKAQRALSAGDGTLWASHIELARIIRRESEGFRDQIRRRGLDPGKSQE